MRISNRVKRNVSFSMMILGCLIILARLWQVVSSPDSATAWIKLAGITLLTYFCFESFNNYRRKIRKGILFGDK